MDVPVLTQTGARLLFEHPGYNYVPAVIQRENYQQIWWCGGPNPTDVIYYRDAWPLTGTFGPVREVLRPSPGSWDAAYVCDPSVIMGSFPYRGSVYRYAMYYTGTDVFDSGGTNNRIGVAFRHDGISWDKCPVAVVHPTTFPTFGYGAGESAVRSGDGKSEVWLWVVDTSSGEQVVRLYHSDDGVTFSDRGAISRKGIRGEFITEPDILFDDEDRSLFLLTDRVNDESVLDIYWMKWDDLFGGNWTLLQSITEQSTGMPHNEGGGFLRNEFGNASPFYPTLIVYFATGEPRPSVLTWNLSWVSYRIDRI